MSNSDFIVPATLFITVKDQLNGLDAIDQAHKLADRMQARAFDKNDEDHQFYEIDLHLLQVAKEVVNND